jgi:predicted Zn-dependent protease
MKKQNVVLSILLAFFFAGSVSAQEDDALLRIMQGEMDREYQQLQQQPVKPYYMSLRIDDFQRTNVQSNLGVTVISQTQRGRALTPQIRVGSRKLDNFKLTTQGFDSRNNGGPQTTALPMDDNDADGIRAGIWSDVRQRYDYAVDVYRETQARVQTAVANEDTSACFSASGVEKYYEPQLTSAQTTINLKEWQQRLDRISGAMAANKELHDGTATLSFEVRREYFINTEGTSVVQNHLSARVLLTALGIADDGMELPISQDFYATHPDSLPSVEVMIEAARQLVKRVVALKHAPVANPYTGPAILSGPASGVFFHEIFGHRLESHRLKSGGETFRNMVGRKVLPIDFQVFCDPSRRYYKGKALNGFYRYDDEGVRSQRVDNIRNGVLTEFLLSRVPMDGFPHSNGHGRASEGYDAVSRQSNLIIETAKPQTEAKLRQMLKDEARRQGREYGYYFQTVVGGYTTTGQGNTMNSFNVSPVEVLRVYVDGRPDELVRGVDLIGTPLSMFSHISAAGNDPTIFTGSCGAESGWVPVACVSPQIFVTQIETQRRKKSTQTPPILRAPVVTQHDGLPKEELSARQMMLAIDEELHRAADSLNVQGGSRPLSVSCIANSYRTVHVVSELGGTPICELTPWTTNVASEVVIGDSQCSSRMDRERYFSRQVGLQPTADALRRAVWQTADQSYKDALNVYAQKLNYLNRNPMPAADRNLPDFVAPAKRDFTPNDDELHFEDIDTAAIRRLTAQLSRIFVSYPDLFGTSVSFDGAQMHTMRSTSSGLHVANGQQWVQMMVDASTQSEDGTPWHDTMTLLFPSWSQLSSQSDLEAKVKRFADDMMAIRNAPRMDEDYQGPVMYEGMAAAYAIVGKLLVPGGLLSNHSIRPVKDDLGKKMGEKVIDDRISVVNYSKFPTYKGHVLLGSYNCDADGVVPADEQVLVENGVMRAQLNNLRPTPYAQGSTGSFRFSTAPRLPFPAIAAGSVNIKAVRTTDEAKMMKELTKAARKAGKHSAYVLSLPEGCTLLRLYRVDLKTGQRTLLGADNFQQPESEQLKSLVAISAEETVSSDNHDALTSLIAPRSIIVGNGVLAKAAMTTTAKPAVTYPVARQ